MIESVSSEAEMRRLIVGVLGGVSVEDAVAVSDWLPLFSTAESVAETVALKENDNVVLYETVLLPQEEIEPEIDSVFVGELDIVEEKESVIDGVDDVLEEVDRDAEWLKLADVVEVAVLDREVVNVPNVPVTWIEVELVELLVALIDWEVV